MTLTFFFFFSYKKFILILEKQTHSEEGEE